LNIEETVNLAKQLCNSLKGVNGKKAEIVFCPSFTALSTVNDLLKKINATQFKLGAQDVFWQEKGAFTGEISPNMLEEAGCSYVIIGHSERRQNLGETDEIVNKKIKTVLKYNLTPIVCVGETYDERQKGIRDVVVARQVGSALEGTELFGVKRICIAYEPVWVIGTGQAVEPEDAEHSHHIIREALFDLFPIDVVENYFNIIYGGSVDSANIKAFIDRENIDGVLVGGASLKADEFVKMINEIT